MEILKKQCLFLLFFVPFFMNAQSFYKRYTTLTPFNSGNGIAQLPDSSFVVTGSSGGLDNASGQAFLMQIDTAGNQMWTKSYGGYGDDIGVRVKHLPGFGFFIAGYSNSTENGDFDFVVYRTDEQGNLLWEKFYGTPNWEQLRDAQLLADGGLILVGQSEGSTTNGTDMFMVRIDSDGEEIWSKTISSPKDDIIYAVDTLANNEILIGGDLGDDDGILKGTLLFLDENGQLISKKVCDEDPDAKIRDFTIFEGQLYLIGGVQNENQSRFGLWYGKYELDGTYIGHITNEYSGFMEYSAIAIRDQFSVFIGLRGDAPEISPYPEGTDAMVTIFGTGLEYRLESVSISGRGDDIINQIILTKEGSIILVGTVSDEKEITSSGTHVVVVKLAPDDSYLIDPNVGESLVHILEENAPDFYVYPNPTKGKIKIPAPYINKNFSLIDMKGKVLKSGKLNSAIDLTNFDNGIYILSVQEKNSIRNIKIVKH